jgi:enamine deaminase RidA (YjgF/YER057c/UK114 family)
VNGKMSGAWDAIREQLGDRTETIREALGDVEAICGSSPIGWVHRGDEEKVTVYVLDAGVLHRVNGVLEARASDLGEAPPRTCEHQMAAITKDARCTLNVTRQQRANSTDVITRRWLFQVGTFPELEVKWAGERAQSDPTPFARALAAEIASVGSREREGD